ncbi:unnamed protein product [Soboliphyme baturini]|uniref:Prolyl endopeptidase n=1 Tax=Soboliphyme baturini TaxID=241478 RepID=A0A183IXF1_9BILA|nr:unnamed protein product [Soboliphyme baturini]
MNLFSSANEVTEDGQYCVCSVERGCEDKNLLYYCALGAIDGNITGPFFTILSDLQAPMFKIIRIDVTNPAKENWQTVVPEATNDVLQWASRVNKTQMILCYLKDVKNVLQVHDFVSGQQLFTLPLEVGSVSQFFGKEDDSEVFFCCESFVVPGTIYRVDLQKPNPVPEVLWQTKLPGISPSDFETEQVFYATKDGTKIPMFVIHRKDVVKSPDCPAILYGYGGFEIPLVPMFGVVPFIMMNEFKGIYAVANLRGGSEYGQKWHQSGMKQNKQNVFDDFIAAAEYLIDQNYTSREKLTISGASNGGLLVSACAIQRPDLFGCVICKVGVLDMLRYHRFTIGEAWVPEYGSAEEPESFSYLIKYSPLHCFKCLANGQQYPAMLLLTADHDDRVVPSHSLKFIANAYYTLKDCKSQRNPIMISIETKAGHGVGKPTQKLVLFWLLSRYSLLSVVIGHSRLQIKEWTDIYSFIYRVLNLKFDAS